MHLNKERAYDVMDRYGLKGLVATVGINVFYLSEICKTMTRPASMVIDSCFGC